MRLAHTFLVFTILAISEQHEISKRASEREKRVVCYYTNWSVYRPGTAKFNPQNINPYLCTHLIYAFGGLDRENGLRPYDKYQDIEQGGYAKFTGLKTYNKQLKTLLAIGGWNEGSARFSPLVADEERRREFVKNVIKFLRQNHFDGLDLDWEYPAYRDGGKPRDKDNYAQLVQELSEEFDRESSKTGRPRLLLTMAVPAGIEYIDKGYDIPKLNRYLDFMNILSYDYHSAFEPSVNHHSPLYSIEEDSEYNFDSQLTIDATVKHYLMKGADAEKLVLGIPTYGRSYTLFNPESTDLGAPSDGPGEQGEATREKGYLAYYEICNNINDGWTIVQPKESAMGPYAFKENQWVGYDDEAIVRKKSQYVNEKNLGGIMFWSIDNDDFRGKCHSRPYPLIEAAKEALLGKGVSNKLPSGTRGGKTSKTGKAKATPRTTTTPVPPSATATTPEPPTTPDPGSDFVCKDEGFFPHPRDCKKYFWCLDSGPSDLGIVAHQFTCPSGLYFNKAADSCDFSRNVICKKKSGGTTTTSTTTSTTTAAPKSTKSFFTKNALPPRTTTIRTTTTTTTTTTEAPYIEEEVEDDEDYKEEDPQTIKQLIQLIKKLGGVAELEKQLEGNSGSGVDSTTPAISKSLYERVISSGSPRYQTIQRNGPSGPQNEGLPRERSSFRRDKPQYVTIKRDRPSTTTESTEIVYAVEEDVDDVEEEAPKYKTISRNRESQSPFLNENSEKAERPKYQSSERFRPKVRTEEASEKSTTLKYTSILRSRAPTSDSTATTSKYVVLQRQRTTNQQPVDIGTTENELNDEEEVTEHIIETTTSRPLVKVSDIVPTTVIIPTSTRVVTEIVEGATRRQRVPLSKLRHFLKDLDNSVIETVTLEKNLSAIEELQTERPFLHGFPRRRPEIVITTTARTTPAFLSARRNRFRSTTEPTESSTRGRFVPSRNRDKSVEENKDQHRFKPLNPATENIEDLQKNTSEPSVSSPDDITTPKNRFYFRRRTTRKPESEKQEDVLVRGSSRESNVIRKPIYKPRFPSRRRSTTETPQEVPIYSSTETPQEVPIYSSTENEIISPTTESNADILSSSTTESSNISAENNFPANETLLTNSPSSADTLTFNSSENKVTTEFPSTIVQPILVNGTSSNAQILNLTENNKIITNEKEIVPSDINASTEKGEEIVQLVALEETEAKEGESKSSTTSAIIYSTEDISPTTLSPNEETTIQDSPVQTEDLSSLRSRFNHGRNFLGVKSLTNNLTPGNSNNTGFQQEKELKRKIIMRRRKPTTESNIILDVTEPEVKKNRTTVIRRRRPIQGDTGEQLSINHSTKDEVNKKIQRGKIRFYNKEQKKVSNTYEDNLASSSKDTSRTRLGLKVKTNVKPDAETKPKNNNPLKHKRIVIRGRKKFTGSETDSSNDQRIKNAEIDNHDEKLSTASPQDSSTINPKLRNRVRKVVLRKPVRDLAVEESMSPGKGGSYEKSSLVSHNDGSEVSNVDLDVDFTEDIFNRNIGAEEIQTRGRRPFRKTVVRSTTTTTETPPTTARQRTTVQSLRQRLNRFKTERNFSKSTPPSVKEQETAVLEDEPSTSRPVRKEFRRLIRPLRPDDSQLDASHDIRLNTPQNAIRVTAPQKQYLEQVTEGSQMSEEYTDEEPLVLPDLANVAVAAIQSLATSPPTPTTEEYKVPVRAKTSRPVKVVQRRPNRPTSRAPATRSSPRPFTKANYEETEDYYAEPVDVPLSGKVRIHNDGFIECLDIGNFPHPFSCRKFISCAKMENSHLLGWEYTCPKGLSFDPIGGICNWNAGLGCKE